MAFAGHAGTLHRPGAGQALDTAVVICPPVGREARSAYRPIWRWAQQLADQGLQVLRYDHLGEGDSADIAPTADQWRAWTDGVCRAVALVREHAGASRVVLVGLRAGATLAATAAAESGADDLVLIAPFETGAAWLNELRLAARVKGGELSADGAIAVDGLQLAAATVESIESVRLRELTCDRVLVAGGKAGRSDRRHKSQPFPGLNKMFKDAHVNDYPEPPLARIADWMLMGAAPAADPPPCPPAGLASDDWAEAVVEFGAGLRGVLCLPRGVAPSQGVIFGNTGGDPRAGIGSFAARASRALAAAGVAAFRVDFAGVGESAAADGWRSHVYETSRVADFQAAAAVLRDQGVSDITLAGVCTGGYHAAHAVLADAGFDKAVAFNAWLVWRPGAELESVELRSQLRSMDMPLLANGRGVTLKDGIAWRARRLREALSLSWKAIRPDEAAQTARRAIAMAGGRGVRIHLVFGRGDVSTRGLHADFHRHGRWLTRRQGVTISLQHGLDHALFSRDSQAAACAELCSFLGVRPSAADAIVSGPDAEEAEHPVQAPSAVASQAARSTPEPTYGVSSINRSTGALARTSR